MNPRNFVSFHSVLLHLCVRLSALPSLKILELIVRDWDTLAVCYGITELPDRLSDLLLFTRLDHEDWGGRVGRFVGRREEFRETKGRGF